MWLMHWLQRPRTTCAHIFKNLNSQRKNTLKMFTVINCRKYVEEEISILYTYIYICFKSWKSTCVWFHVANFNWHTHTHSFLAWLKAGRSQETRTRDGASKAAGEIVNKASVQVRSRFTPKLNWKTKLMKHCCLFMTGYQRHSSVWGFIIERLVQLVRF